MLLRITTASFTSGAAMCRMTMPIVRCTILLIVGLLAGCAVNLASFPQPYEVSSAKGYTDIRLYVGSVNLKGVYENRSANDNERIKDLLISHLANAHYFKSVADISEKKDVPGERYLVLNANVTPRESGKFNWWYSWPAIYPMPLYWPLQKKDGTVSVRVDGTFYDESGAPVVTLTSTKKDEYHVTFYGFFRTGSAEDKLKKCYEDSISDVVAQITGGKVLAALGPASREKAVSLPPVAAFQRSIQSDVDEIPSAKMQKQKNAYAIVIGIEQYRQKLPHVDFAVKDAMIFSEYLTKVLGYQEENVVVLLNEKALKSDFEKYFEKWLWNNVEADGTVFVYFSGHGAPDPKTGSAYLVPYDGDPTFIDQTGYSLKRMYGALTKLPAKRIVVVLDSCFSGAGGRSVLAKGARPLVMSVRESAVPKNLTVLSAASGGQISSTYDEKGHGLFTYFLLKGIKTGDVVRQDGSLKIDDLYEYLKPQVERIARKRYNNEQTPRLIQPDQN